MGIVYRARHLALDRIRALKVLSPELSEDPTYVARFRRESRLAASVDHPAVVTVHHAGEEDGRLYMSMQYVDGVDLGRLLADGPLSPARARAILDQLAAGLDAAHAAGLIHRDVKPENVLLSGARDAERAYLTDFGIGTVAGTADRRTTRLTAEGIVLGTSSYMAPRADRRRCGRPARRRLFAGMRRLPHADRRTAVRRSQRARDAERPRLGATAAGIGDRPRAQRPPRRRPRRRNGDQSLRPPGLGERLQRPPRCRDRRRIGRAHLAVAATPAGPPPHRAVGIRRRCDHDRRRDRRRSGARRRRGRRHGRRRCRRRRQLRNPAGPGGRSGRRRADLGGGPRLRPDHGPGPQRRTSPRPRPEHREPAGAGARVRLPVGGRPRRPVPPRPRDRGAEGHRAARGSERRRRRP